MSGEELDQDILIFLKGIDQVPVIAVNPSLSSKHYIADSDLSLGSRSLEYSMLGL